MKTVTWIGRMGLVSCLASTGCALGSGDENVESQGLGCDADHAVHEPDGEAPSLPMISSTPMQRAEANLEEFLAEWDVEGDDRLSVGGSPLVRFELTEDQTLADAATALEKARDLARLPDKAGPTRVLRMSYTCVGWPRWMVCCDSDNCKVWDSTKFPF